MHGVRVRVRVRVNLWESVDPGSDLWGRPLILTSTLI